MGLVARSILVGLLLGCACASVIASPTYFLVAEPPSARLHGDSFVLPLEANDDIAHARDLIARGRELAGSPIVFAEIVKGSDGLNRNLLDPTQPEWSWHVSRFNGFGDFGIELIDGWPTYVEQNLDEWIRATGEGVDRNQTPSPAAGNIGFWSYTVVAELGDVSPTLPPIASIPLPGGLLTGLLTMGVAGVWMFRSAWRR